jgi:plastocyanin
MIKKGIALIMALAMLSVLFTACTTRNGCAASSGPAVQMNNTNFKQSSITIKKDQMLNLVDDVNIEHIITNGTWQGTTQVHEKKAGAPSVSKTFHGNDSSSVGPFTTAGTFQLYCTIHQGMNLTVKVQ